MKLSLFLSIALAFASLARGADRPNILWLTSEDHGPHLGCYGDSYATTPNVDALAAKGIHLHALLVECAGLRAGAHDAHLRHVSAESPAASTCAAWCRCRRARRCSRSSCARRATTAPTTRRRTTTSRSRARSGTSRRSKATGGIDAAGQPFFAVFNSEKSHESQIRKRPHTQVHDPAKVRVPAYHPDTPEVRQDWAQYYDGVTEADADAGARLKELADAGLAEDTIVFYYADHGSGMPRNKRWPYNSGLHVPLVVYIPEKFKELRPPEYKAGGDSDRLVSFVDFAPTLLSLAGVQPPEWMQGHAFLGKFIAPAQPFLYGFRGRMDERVDLRAQRHRRPLRLRPQLHAAPDLRPAPRTTCSRRRRRACGSRCSRTGKLNAAQAAFWKTKPPEELYDLQSDPDEVHNLAGLSEQNAAIEKFRAALRAHELRIRDVGLLPEGEMHRRSAGAAPYDLGHDEAKLNFARIYETAELASSLKPEATPALKASLADTDSAVRYWSVLGLLMRGAEAVKAAHDDLVKALDDEAPDVRIAAAEALGHYGDAADLARVLPALAQQADWSKNDVFTAMAALNALTALREKAAPLAAAIRSLPDKGSAPDARFKEYVPRLLEDLRER